MFNWDTQKALSNYEKHRVSFEEAATIFSDENALDWADTIHSQVESRFKRNGKSIEGRILMVVHDEEIKKWQSLRPNKISRTRRSLTIF